MPSKKIRELEEQAAIIVLQELKKAGINYHDFRTKVHPFKTVGVQGDERTYSHPVEIEIISEEKRIIYEELLERISTRITNETEINRVLYTVASK